MKGGWAMAACAQEDVAPTWGPLEDEEYKTPLKLHGAGMAAGAVLSPTGGAQRFPLSPGGLHTH